MGGGTVVCVRAYVRARAHVFVCVLCACVCVCERERERERETTLKSLHVCVLNVCVIMQ